MKTLFVHVNLPILSSLLKARVQICTYYPLIKLGTPNVFHTVQRILMIVVFDEAKSTRCLVKAI